MAKKTSKKEEFNFATERLAVHDFFRQFKSTYKDENWYSSAQQLENSLLKQGLKPPQRLYYDYKFPDDLKNFEIEQKTVIPRCFCAIYESFLEKLETDDVHKRLDAVVTNTTDMTYYYSFNINLAMSDIKNFKSLMDKIYKENIKKIYKMADAIKALNPELQHIPNHRNLHFVNGTIYGFAPQEIYYFLNAKELTDEEFDEEMQLTAPIHEFTGEYITYRLSPETTQSLIDAIQKHRGNAHE